MKANQISRSIYLLTFVLLLQPYTSSAGPNSKRVIHFPPDRSMGSIYVREVGKTGYHDWQMRGEALGNIELPEDMERKLQLSTEGCVDLSPLAALSPDDLHEFCFPIYPRSTMSPLKNEQLIHISHLTSLRKLRLDANPVTDAGLIHLRGLTSLKELRLAFTDVTDGGLAHLRGLDSLRLLSLIGSQITDEGLIHVKDLPRLESLSLNETKVTDVGLSHLAEMSSLLELNLGETRTSARGLKKLKLKLPNCRIYGKNTDGTMEVFLIYSMVFLVIVCGLNLALDRGFLGNQTRIRLIALASIAGFLVFPATVLPMTIHNFRYGQESLWQEHFLILALAFVYGIVIFFRHLGEFLLYSRKTIGTWIYAGEKCLTSIVVLLLGYVVYWLAVVQLTEDYFEGDNSMAFLVIIPIGVTVSLLGGLTNGIFNWVLLRKARTAEKYP